MHFGWNRHTSYRCSEKFLSPANNSSRMNEWMNEWLNEWNKIWKLRNTLQYGFCGTLFHIYLKRKQFITVMHGAKVRLCQLQYMWMSENLHQNDAYSKPQKRHFKLLSFEQQACWAIYFLLPSVWLCVSRWLFLLSTVVFRGEDNGVMSPRWDRELHSIAFNAPGVYFLRWNGLHTLNSAIRSSAEKKFYF